MSRVEDFPAKDRVRSGRLKVSRYGGVGGEAVEGAGGGGGGLRARGGEREAGAGRGGVVEPAGWRDAPLPLAGWGPRVRGGRGGGALVAGARDLRRGLVIRVPQELPGALADLPGVRVGPARVRALGAAAAALRA